MSTECLLLQFSDGREVFTNKKNNSLLSEFIKIFNVKILNVEADCPNLLSLKDIAKVFCDQNIIINKCNYKVFNLLKTEVHTKESSKRVFDMRTLIESELLDGNTIRIKELHRNFQKHKVAVSTIYKHLNYIKDKFKKEGRQITKVGTGCYRLT